MLENENVGSESEQQSPVSNDVATKSEQSVQGFNPSDYVHKDRVQELVHTRTREASERAASKTRAEFEQQQKQGVGLGGMQQFDPSKISELVRQGVKDELTNLRQTTEKEAYEKRVNDLTADYVGKLQSQNPQLLKAREQEIGEMFQLIPYINETGEAAAITEHLLDNEGAYANLMVLSHTAPGRVRSAIKKIESSIKANKEALSRDYPNDPLSQPSPSVTSADAGDSIEALKRQSWLKG
jgi:hypothetical protein